MESLPFPSTLDHILLQLIWLVVHHALVGVGLAARILQSSLPCFLVEDALLLHAELLELGPLLLYSELFDDVVGLTDSIFCLVSLLFMDVHGRSFLPNNFFGSRGELLLGLVCTCWHFHNFVLCAITTVLS